MGAPNAQVLEKLGDAVQRVVAWSGGDPSAPLAGPPADDIRRWWVTAAAYGIPSATVEVAIRDACAAGGVPELTEVVIRACRPLGTPRPARTSNAQATVFAILAMLEVMAHANAIIADRVDLPNGARFDLAVRIQWMDPNANLEDRWVDEPNGDPRLRAIVTVGGKRIGTVHARDRGPEHGLSVGPFEPR